MPDESQLPGVDGETEEFRFWGVARSLGFLEEPAADTLLRDATERRLSPSQIALESGVLNITQVDVVETLLRPATVIPGYEILDFVGQGGMGVVFRARQKTLQRIVALKTVLVSQLSTSGAATRFEQEAVTVARLQHPHIVAAYDFGRHAGRLFFAMEFVEGEDVEQRIERLGRMTEATAWGLARQAAAGLAHAAHLGIVHRDVKPANLLLVDPPAGFPLPAGLPMVKIADFGLAFLTQEAEARTRLTAANAAVGSPHYMAPEQMDNVNVDLRADIYALGATVYQMLSGVAPFSGGTLTQILAQKMSRGPQPLESLVPTLSDETIDLVKAMMARDSADRPPDYATLLARIDRVLELLRDRGPAAVASSPQHAPGHLGIGTATLPEARRARDSAGVTVELPSRTASSHEPVETLHSSQSSTGVTRTAEPVRRAPSLKVVAGIALGILAIAVGASFFIDRNTALPSTLEMTGRGEPLFDGMTLARGWRITAGLWKVVRDDDDAGVISGADGRIERTLRLHDWAGEHAPMFRVTLFVHPKDAESVDVQFSLTGANDADKRPQRPVLRFTKGTAVLGSEAGEGAPFQSRTVPLRLIKTSTGAHVVRIERHESRWWVWVDDTLLGGARASAGELPTFALRVNGGTAWFSDVHLEELERPK
ncbi:MAG: serine/threonine protein kinase [Planctomycetaceae bacterium]|nr:serine/threonine protein kinase [Planctomycetaceae bacterium]